MRYLSSFACHFQAQLTFTGSLCCPPTIGQVLAKFEGCYCLSLKENRVATWCIAFHHGPAQRIHHTINGTVSKSPEKRRKESTRKTVVVKVSLPGQRCWQLEVKAARLTFEVTSRSDEEHPRSFQDGLQFMSLKWLLPLAALKSS